MRVHPQMLEAEKLPPDHTGKAIWKHRFKDIRAFEHRLARNGTLILKFHLRISKEEQRQRFLARLDEPAKRWKFSMNDVAERKHWDDYMAAYEDMIRETSTDYAPWYVVPADHKHVAWLVVSAAIIEALEKLSPKPPKISGEKLKELKAAEKALARRSARIVRRTPWKLASHTREVTHRSYNSISAQETRAGRCEYRR